MLLDKKKVVLGLSGGVDSTFAALTLKKQGFTVVGLYFDVSGNNSEGKAAAEKVAKDVGIEFVYKNVSKDFSNIVIDNFCKEYIGGRTPNPCIVCNPTVKFKILIEEADKRDAYYIATGHYAQTVYDEKLKGWFIKKGINEKKDQSYMLYRLKEDVIKRTIFPLGQIEDKKLVRENVRENNLSNADEKDSQEICFIEDNYVDFLKEQGFQSSKGNFVNKEGEKIGEHQGIINYTIGQRKGLGVTFGKPVFVTKINADENTVTLGENEDLFKEKIYSMDNIFVMSGNDTLPKALENSKIHAKIRYASRPSEGIIRSNKDKIEVEFIEKQRAATPGQSIVFYLDDKVLGGGFISP